MSTVDKYQGRLSSIDKATVAHRIDEGLAEGCENVLTEEVTDGCQRLAQLLLTAARPRHYVAASESSDISAVLV